MYVLLITIQLPLTAATVLPETAAELHPDETPSETALAPEALDKEQGELSEYLYLRTKLAPQFSSHEQLKDFLLGSAKAGVCIAAGLLAYYGTQWLTEGDNSAPRPSASFHTAETDAATSRLRISAGIPTPTPTPREMFMKMPTAAAAVAANATPSTRTLMLLSKQILNTLELLVEDYLPIEFLKKNSPTPKLLIGLLTAAILAQNMPFLQSAISTQPNLLILKSFIRNWAVHKPNTPKEYHAAFDALSNYYLKDAQFMLSEQEARAIISYLRGRCEDYLSSLSGTIKENPTLALIAHESFETSIATLIHRVTLRKGTV